MAFSILSGLLGVAAIVWYGLADVNQDYGLAEARVAESHAAVPASNGSEDAAVKHEEVLASSGGGVRA